MNFCPECEFMVYTKLNDERTALTNYCKNCSWEGEYLQKDDGKSICVYKKNYSNDFLAQQAFTNKYTVFDPTLPRINNIACINEKCLTNSKFQPKKTLHIVNATELCEKNQEEIDTILNDFYTKNGLSVEDITNVIVNNNEIISEFSEEIEASEFSQTGLEKPINVDGLESQIVFKHFIKPKREVIFMKYDELRMKYLYLCTTCNTSWKNQ